MDVKTRAAPGKTKRANRQLSAMRQCPNCDRPMHRTSTSGLTLEQCPTCRGIWLDRQVLDMVWACLRQLQMEWETEHNPVRPRPSLYDLDHVDVQHTSMSTSERDKRWSELLKIFE